MIKKNNKRLTFFNFIASCILFAYKGNEVFSLKEVYKKRSEGRKKGREMVCQAVQRKEGGGSLKCLELFTAEMANQY